MTPAEQERAAVVAWLDASISYMAGFTDHVKALEITKGAILRGEHLDWPIEAKGSD